MTDAVEPTTPEAAQGRLTELSSNPEWSSKVAANDPAAFAEFAALTKTVAAGTTANNAAMTADFLAGPLPAGFPSLDTPPGAELAQFLKGEKTISPDLHRRVQDKLDSMIADAGWRARFDAKDQVALREWQLATNLLAAEVAP